MMESSGENLLDFVVAGQICLDIIPEIPATGARSVSDLLRPGKLLQVGRAHLSTGGPVANVGLALAKQGFSVALVARIGRDAIASVIDELLRDWPVETHFRLVTDAQTSYTVAIAPPEMDRMLLHAQGANAGFCAADVPDTLLHRARLFHFGYPPAVAAMYRRNGEELQRLFEKVRAAGLTTSLDLTLPDPEHETGRADWRRILSNVLPSVDLFLPSIEELLFMLDRPTYDKLRRRVGTGDLLLHIEPQMVRDLAGQALAFGCRVIGIKSGFRGFYLRTSRTEVFQQFGKTAPQNPKAWSNRELWAPAFVCEKVASATGSGDSAVAGFLSGFVRGYDPETTLQLANCLGWQNLSAYDGISGIREWEETLNLLQSEALTPRRLGDLLPPDWQWDSQKRLWHGPADGR